MARYGLIVVFISKGRRTDTCGLREKSGEIGVVLETKLTGNLLYALSGIGQFAFHPERNGALDIFAGAVADSGGENLVQIARGDVQLVGIERWLAMAGDVLIHQLDESQQYLAMSRVQAIGIVVLAHHFGKDVNDGANEVLGLRTFYALLQHREQLVQFLRPALVYRQRMAREGEPLHHPQVLLSQMNTIDKHHPALRLAHRGILMHLPRQHTTDMPCPQRMLREVHIDAHFALREQTEREVIVTMQLSTRWHHDVWCQPPYADAALSVVGYFVGGDEH